jgi:hypothetical protein
MWKVPRRRLQTTTELLASMRRTSQTGIGNDATDFGTETRLLQLPLIF